MSGLRAIAGTSSFAVVLAAALAVLAPSPLRGEKPSGKSPRDLLSTQEWKRLDDAVDRGLEFLIRRQQPDGSFAAPELGQPGITSLCLMAFLSRGHVPREGRYGKRLERAIEFVLASQRDDGLIFNRPIEAVWTNGTASHTGIYNHAISGTMLSEVYGMTEPELQQRLTPAIAAALRFSREHQLRPKRSKLDKGGSRYLGSLAGLRSEADLSVTAWQLIFLRSARNAEFVVPKEAIDDAMGFVRGTYVPADGSFHYGRAWPNNHATRAMVGSGILALSMAGEHQSDMAQQAGEWMLKHPFERYNQVRHAEERYHYSVYICGQAMFQLGGDYWERFFPPIMQALLEHQQADGSWPPESNRDGHFGNTYTTALVVLALTPPYQLLPIYQR